MKVKYAVTPQLVFELEGGDQKEIFEQLFMVQDVFMNDTCKKCGGKNLQCVVRTVEENKYYELRCKSCFAKLSFGSHKKGGTLFPKRKDEEGKWIGTEGWTLWNRETKQAE